MLAETCGPTAGQQRYGSAFNATQEQADDDSTATILESVTRYAERATAAESEVSDLKSAVSALQQQMAAMAMGQQAAFFGQQQPSPTIHIPKKRKTPREGATEPAWAQQ